MRKEKYIQEGKSKKGTYLRVIIKYPSGGTRKTYSKYFYTCDYSSPKLAMISACMDRDKFLAKLKEGVNINSTHTLQEVYELSKQIYPTSLKTQERHDSFFRSAMTRFADTPIEKITAPQIQAYLNEYAQTHSDDGITRMVTFWKRIYHTAQIHDMDIKDQSINLIKPRSKKVHVPKNVTISDEDYQTFLSTLQLYNYSSESSMYLNRTIYFMLEVMHYTGMRPAEVLALTRDDIHDSYITVNKAIGSTATKKKQVVPTKTYQSVREIPISAHLKPILADLLSERKTLLLLTDIKGNALEIDYISHYIHRVSQACKIQFNSYMLRHKFSTDMVLQGVDIRTTQDLMGHNNINQTVDYARSTSKSREQAIEKIK